ncbi:hypothetical protein T492DRAFT_1042285 [Pavlovales sp. CCMP2436]|nr:hypothetical protein T492DRAFT_1042285 [Pavlovales sp. CCMP2436]|mmetsp:Transcript_1507/g.3983  ORF Transcript_1507/g.3983 Transcript_1507/m.3983 type:complete len:263 (+) Transcript_1507:53-841(+)
MLPRIAALFPAGALVGVALLLASRNLAQPFELSVGGKCLHPVSGYGPCTDASAPWYLVGGVVRAAGAGGCLSDRGVLVPYSWAQVGGWSVQGGSLCRPDGRCLGKQGAGAVLVKPTWAARVRFVKQPKLDAHTIAYAATAGAALLAGLAILHLFACDACGGPATQPASARPAGLTAAKSNEPPVVLAPAASSAASAPTSNNPLDSMVSLVKRVGAKKEPPPRLELSLVVATDAKVQVQLSEPVVSPANALCRMLALGFKKKQ